MPSSSLFWLSCAFCSAATWLDNSEVVSFCRDGLLFVQAIQADASGYRNGDSDRAERQAGFVAAFFLSVFSGCGVVHGLPGLFNHGGLILLFRHYGFQC
jgi:hypothetical protein